MLGLNFGLRFHEIAKLEIEHISNTSDGVLLTDVESTQNSTVLRNNEVCDWDGNTSLRYSISMDPAIETFTWSTFQSEITGPLFCGYTFTWVGVRLTHSTSLSDKGFTSFLRDRFSPIGIGQGDVKMYSGHSIWRGSV